MGDDNAWLPIETAPRDGTPVLLFLDPPIDTSDCCGWALSRTINRVVGWASDTFRGDVEWHCGWCEEGTADTEGYSSALMIRVNPTHWRPLPPAPAAQRNIDAGRG